MEISSMVKIVFFVSVICLCGFVAANSGFQQDQKKKTSQGAGKGIGSVSEVKLGNIDQKLVDKGSSIFTEKCTVCHHTDDTNLAPSLHGVTKTVSPVFIMNYLMNTTEMQKKDPYVKNLIQTWKKVPMMKDQHLKQNEARAVLEYLRSVDK